MVATGNNRLYSQCEGSEKFTTEKIVHMSLDAKNSKKEDSKCTGG